MSQPDNDPLVAAVRLERSMSGLRDDIQDLTSYGRRNRHYIWTLGVSLVLDLLLSVAVAVVAVQASSATSLANQNKQTQLATCRAANDVREANKNLWNYVINLMTESAQDRPQAAEASEALRKLRSFVDDVWAQRNCDHPEKNATVPISPPR